VFSGDGLAAIQHFWLSHSDDRGCGRLDGVVCQVQRDAAAALYARHLYSEFRFDHSLLIDAAHDDATAAEPDLQDSQDVNLRTLRSDLFCCSGTRGVGTSRIPLRIEARAELVFLTAS
jgi:hypothetical protein